ncbi:MAG: hypothetical protein WBI18_08230 [Candidatus Saccharicenans sp.]
MCLRFFYIFACSTPASSKHHLYPGYYVCARNNNLIDNYLLSEVHLYAGDFKPEVIAPGQYGYLDYLDPRRNTYTFTVPLTDTNGDGVWFIAHAVVWFRCHR